MNDRAQPSHLSRGIDYLNDIGAKLRNLKGFTTLAHELIQNAEDSAGVSWMCFDVRDDSLVVDNDGIFSDCGSVEEITCPWKPEKGHMCDFHRFRLVGSGDKREEEGKKGAFGIGFIAVYQVTDSPELISAGRHWTVHEDKSEQERIEVCYGCDKCSEHNLPSTRFILPWAKDPNNPLRKLLKVEAISNENINVLFDELSRILPTAMIFLDHIEKIDIKKNGNFIKSLQKIKEQDSLIITDGMPENDRIWHLLSGEFEYEATTLREQHIGLIEKKRSSNIMLAIPHEPMETGVFCAFLPTKQEIGIPLHINADFFTSNDRKGIILEQDYQSEWNRAAISAAASAFRDNIIKLRDKIGHERLWKLIESISRIYHEAEKGVGESSLKHFWEKLLPELPNLKLVFSTQQRWLAPYEILLLEKTEEEASISFLEVLNIAIVHPELRPHFSLLRKEEIGVQLLDLFHIADSLEKIGLTQRVERSKLPDWLKSETALRTLWHELGILQERRRSAEKKKEAEERFLDCAIALGRDGALWPCGQVYQADSETVALFNRIDPTIPFLAELGEEAKFLKSICPEFSAAIAIHRLSQLSQDQINSAWKDGRLTPSNLMNWFESRREEILFSDQLNQKLARLPIFPSASGLRPLSELGLPGDFEDPIGLTDIIDLQQLGGRREFLKELGANELTFLSYATDHIPRAFRDPGTTDEKKQKALRLLAEHRGKIVDDLSARQSLKEIEIIECEDGVFRRPREVYFKSSIITEVLGEEVSFAVIPEDQEAARIELYRWLGVAEYPRDRDILSRVQELTEDPPNNESRAAIQRIFKYLSERKELGISSELHLLSNIKWLPAVNVPNIWFRPSDLYRGAIQYLCETQGNFLDAPPASQTDNILNFLQIKTWPEVPLVAKHLLKCAELNREVHKEVYRFLNDNYKDTSVSNLLKGKNCLLLSDNSYVRPDQVFWGDHPFGRFRYRFNPELRTYNNLFSLLGVRDGPDYNDAIKVIDEISSEYGVMNRILNEDDHAVLFNCWQMLERALETGSIDEKDLEPFKKLKVIPNKDRLLNLPEHMFFEDRAGLAAKFDGFLEKNVIPRPQGAWKAMAAVGVRSLSNAVISHLQECVDPISDELVASRIQERRLQLERAFDPMLAGTDLEVSWDILKQLGCFSVSHLSIYYAVSLFNRERHSAPEAVPAHFRRQESCLYFIRGDGHLPWPSISRELALALCPEAEPGRLASGIKEVLSAGSEAEARAVLDELGFPPLEKGPEGGTPLTDEGVGLGGLEGEVQDVQTPLTPGEAVEAILGPGAPPPESLPPGLGEPPPAGGGPETGAPGPGSGAGTAGPGQEPSAPGRKRQGAKSALRTYVVPPGQEPEGKEEDPERQARRRKIDQEGMKRVLAYERELGRIPKDMGPTHEGYDIESRDGNGEIERYIEVKSLSGDWDPMGVRLTKPQFEKAVDLGEKYWLYVVERAEADDFCLHRINDPARRANEFRYDDGWRALAEEDAEAALTEEESP
jgi:hypothetical protein